MSIEDRYFDVELVADSAIYSDKATESTVKFMMNADIVTIRGTSLEVKEIEVTDNGVIRFHGNIRKG